MSIRALFAVFFLTLIPATASALTVAGFGDSITCVSCNDGSYLGLLADYMDPDPVIDDNGIAADLTSNVLARLDQWILDGNSADWVIILTGTPDTYQAVGGFMNRDYVEDDTVQNISDMLDAVFNAGMSAVLVAPPPVQDPCGFPAVLTCGEIDTRLFNLSSALATLAGTAGVPFVDLYDLFINDPAWANLPPDSGSLFLFDGLHPRITTGDVVIVQAIVAAIPEPSTILLVGLGLVGMAALRRGRRR